MDFWRSLSGMVEAELTSADSSAALGAINRAGITLYRTRQKGELTLSFRIQRSDYLRLSALAKKRGERLELSRRNGIYWVGKKLLHRPLLLLGVTLPIFLSCYLPTRVLFVRVIGNEAIPSRQIIAEAERCGIVFGASRRAVRSEKMKNALLQAIPQLQWAGINTFGCTAVISVRERSIPRDTGKNSSVSSIVALRDGVISEITALEGTPVCKSGEAVKRGQLLISGYTDCGICIRAGQARGEVFALTQRSVDAILPANYDVKGEIIGTDKKYSLRIGKKQINFYKDSGILDTTCDKMYSVESIVLPGGFRLPLSLVTEQRTYYSCASAKLEESEAEAVLSEFASNYLARSMTAGEIRDRTESLTASGAVYRLAGRYACCEMIGKIQIEENPNNYEAD